VQAYMQHVQDNAEASVRRAIAALQDGEFTYPMDDGCQIQVKVTCDRETQSATIDFTGTSAQQPNNFNAPLAVCKAAVLYVFRTLVEDEIPLNAGCLRPLTMIVPEGCLLNPRPPAAVVAGNVETSQAVTDALYGALGVLAASQGTMNNFTFGNPRYQYYETICGGSGAGKTFDGTDAIHTHMTNSRLTDPEVLEWRFPVFVKEFAIRANSGGMGKHRGGNGIIRRIQFREAMTAGILSGHRVVPPFGLQGGSAGQPGRNWIDRADGTIDLLGSNANVEMQPGDIFGIETPGGGGYGAIADGDSKMQIRAEKPEDVEAIRQVNILAFGRESEANLVDRLRGVASTFSFVAVESEQIVGHIFFSPVTIVGEGGADLRLLGLAPVAVLPNYQRQGVGSLLIQQGLATCDRLGFQAVVVLGSPTYYSRFGFRSARKQGLGCEYPAPDEAFMVLELKPRALEGCVGTVKYHSEFNNLE
jgi:predicted N-acetyltransferase YhbS